VQRLLNVIETAAQTGLRDRALLGVLAYTFARIGAVVNLKEKSGSTRAFLAPSANYCNLHCNEDAFVINSLHYFRTNIIRPISFSLLALVFLGVALVQGLARFRNGLNCHARLFAGIQNSSLKNYRARKDCYYASATHPPATKKILFT
jgi:hypothetical protein